MKLTEEQHAQRRRLRTWLEYKQIGRQALVKMIGKKLGTINQLLSGGSPISEPIYLKLSKYYTDFPEQWVRSGEGEMIVREHKKNIVEEPSAEYENYELKVEDTMEWRMKQMQEEVAALWEEVRALRARLDGK